MAAQHSSNANLKYRCELARSEIFKILFTCLSFAYFNNFSLANLDILFMLGHVGAFFKC